MFCWTPGGACSASPVNTDPTGCGTGGVPQATEWDEVAAKDPYGDRRFLQSAGPFTLKAGAVNKVTVGMVWDRPGTSGQCNIAPICLIQQDADLAQALFNSNFAVLNGPDAPDLSIQELNDELIITVSNKTSSNNYNESYQQTSPTIIGYADSTYKFEGYQIFQVVDSTVTGTQADLQDPTKARLVAQCDIKNGVSTIVNWEFSSTYGAAIPYTMVSGGDKGVVHSFDIKQDLFQIDNIPTLVNDRPYYYLAIAYAYNNYSTYNATTNPNGQKLPYLQGRRNIKVYPAVPHIPQAQSYGTVQNSSYGNGPAITRIEGHGNGTNVIELDQNSINYILQHDTMAHPTYLPGQGPINVKVVDPLSVVNANFILKIKPGATAKDIDSTATWQLYDVNSGTTINSDEVIGMQNEQILPQYGISITITQPKYSGGKYNGTIDSACSMTFSDPTHEWLKGFQSSAPGTNPAFWIRSGNNIDRNCADNNAYNSYPVATTNPCPSQVQTYFFDANQYYNQILGGTWAPMGLTAVSDNAGYVDNGPGWGCQDSVANMASVDIIITNDQTKWTRCVVFEEQDAASLAEGGVSKLQPRAAQSIALDQQRYAPVGSGYSNNPNDPNYISERGMGWFPGYTINLETGERLNMAFGEDSWLNGHNGRDMKWNPDSILYVQNGTGSSGVSQLFGITSVIGGKHYIYVFAHNNNQNGVKYNIPAYDKDSTIMSYFTTPPGPFPLVKKYIFGDVMWVGIPLLKAGHSMLESDVTIRLRVQKPYDSAYGSTTVNNKIMGSLWRNAAPQNNNYPMYSFSTSGLAVDTNNVNAAKSALSLINIVPNPYYGYSSYESDRLDTRVRITNLPPVCNISIFTLNGSLVKVINKSDPSTYIDWNLENQYSVPIASGLYIIHVSVPNVGETTLKWLGVMRPTDLNSY